MRAVVLPGMDGRGKLLRPFCDALPMASEVVSYPTDRALGYRELETRVRDRVSGDEPTVLVAESFSGPIAIRIAADPPPCLCALVLVGTFAVAPAPRILRLGIGAGMFLFPLPRSVVRGLMVGADAPRDTVDDVRAVVGEVHPAVLAHRLREVLSVDARDALRAVRLPILCVQASRDRLLLRERALERARPGLRRATIDGPHLLLQRKPIESAHLVARFVEETVVPAPRDRALAAHDEDRP